MNLSNQAWNMSVKIIDAIYRHPFNTELARGNLAINKFAYYIEQDGIYLKDFARCQAIIASKVSDEYIKDFLDYAQHALLSEQEAVHDFFRKKFNFQACNQLSPATIGYTSYLIRICSIESVEISIAAILPCLWIYREVGNLILKHSSKDNPFGSWINTYSGEKFSLLVERAIDIFNNFGNENTEKVKKEMLQAFYNSVVFEWHFWNDSYFINYFVQI